MRCEKEDDLISRQAAIDVVVFECGKWSCLAKEISKQLKRLPSAQPYTAEEIDKMQELEFMQVDRAYELGRESAQPEQPTEVQDILQYLDEYLHPIVSPEYWSVYSELYDMVSMLQSSQPERKTGYFIGTEFDGYADGSPVYYEWECSECGCVFEDDEPTYNYCPNCGAKMEDKGW